MNYKNLITNSTSVQLNNEQTATLKERSAVSNLPITEGMILAFADNCKAINRTIGNNIIPFVPCVVLPNEKTDFDENLPAMLVSSQSFGRCIVNYAENSVCTPESVATDKDSKFDVKKLIFNQLKESSLLDVPTVLAGKKLRVFAIQTLQRTRKGGEAMLINGEPVFQDVIAFEVL